MDKKTNYFLKSIGLIFVFAIFVLITNPAAKISAFFLLYFISMRKFAINPLDPRVFFMGFFVVYSTFYPIKLLTIGDNKFLFDVNVLNQTLNLSFFAFTVYLFYFGIFIKHSLNGSAKFYDSMGDSNTPNSEIILRSALFGTIIIICISIWSSGATSKRELLDDNLLASNLGNFATLMFAVMAYISFSRNVKRNYVDIFTLFSFFLLFFYMLLTGERDVFFRLCFILLIIKYDFSKKMTATKIVLIFTSIVVLVPFTQAFKAIFLSNQSIALEGLSWDLIFSNEFISAARNLYSLNLYGVEQSFGYLVNDVIRAFVPKILFNNGHIESTVAWFHNIYRPDHGFSGTSGWGFTSVGMGYLVSGYSGVFIITSIISGVLIFFHNKKYCGKLWFAFYLMILMTAIYTIRADMANFLSQSFKVGGFFMLIIHFTSKLLTSLKAQD